MSHTPPESPPSNNLLHDARVQADRLMRLLLIAHFPVAIGLAFLHGAWLVALIGGGAATAATVWATTRHTGTLLSRFVVAASLMVYSAVFIQETQGLVEMHFHVFVSLAFLLVYRDWRAPVVRRRRHRDPPRRGPSAPGPRRHRSEGLRRIRPATSSSRSTRSSSSSRPPSSSTCRASPRMRR